MGYNWAKYWEGYHPAFDLFYGGEPYNAQCFPNRSVSDIRWLLAQLWRPGVELTAESLNGLDSTYYIEADQLPMPYTALPTPDQNLAIEQWKHKLTKATPKSLRAALMEKELEQVARTKAEKHHYIVGYCGSPRYADSERFLIPLKACHMREDGRSFYETKLEEKQEQATTK